MPANTPHEICRLFQQYIGDGDVDAVLGLYDEEAVFLKRSAEVTEGRQGLREELASLAAAKPRFEFDVRQVVQAGDMALMHTRWQVSHPEPATVHAIEVARRQADGTWRWLIGDPFTVGRELEPARTADTGAHLFNHGRLSYVQIPALDCRDSARFYAAVFDWQIRGGNESHLSFTDATGDMIGAWVTGRTVASEPGVLPYIYVHGIDAVLDRVLANGGELAEPPYPEGELWVARFRDPAGNVVGVWQQGPR